MPSASGYCWTPAVPGYGTPTDCLHVSCELDALLSAVGNPATFLRYVCESLFQARFAVHAGDAEYAERYIRALRTRAIHHVEDTN